MVKIFNQRLSVLISLVFIFNSLLFAQTTPISKKITNPEPVKAGIKYNFRNYDIEQGLENSYITCLFEDHYGNIWSGSAGSGACCFNGKSFSYLNETNGLSNNNIESIIEDSKNNLWFGTLGGGLIKYDGKIFKIFNIKTGFPTDDVWKVIESHNGKIWVGTANTGVFLIDGEKTFNFSVKEGLCHNFIRTLFEDSNGNIWVGSDGGGISKISDGKITNYGIMDGVCHNRILAFAEDKNHNIWVGSYGGGICIFDGSGFTPFVFNEELSSKAICDLIFDNYGNLWIGTSGGGLNKYDGKKLTHYTTNDGLVSNEIISVIQDVTGSIWLATYGNGLCRFNSESFAYFSVDEGLPSNSIKSILEDKQGNMWFSTSGGGIAKYDGKSFFNYGLQNGVENRYILSSCMDSLGNIWFGTSGGGAMYYDGKEFNYYTVNNGLCSNYILCIFIDSKNRVWFGNYGGCTTMLDKEGFHDFDKKTGLASNYINVIRESADGKIWFGSESNGLYVYDENSIISKYNDVIPEKCIKSIFFDKQSRIWIGTYGGGVYIVDGEKIIRFDETKGLSNNYIQFITCDRENNMLVGTNRGFTKMINKSNTSEKYFLPEFEEFYIKTYGINEGFTGNNCYTNAVCVDNQNNVWIGTGKKLTKYVSSFDKINLIEPKLILSGIKIFFEEINWADKSKKYAVTFDTISNRYNIPKGLVVPYSQNHFTFVFSGINMKFPEKVRYSYYLEGLETDWSPVSDKTEVTYSGLNPGHYIFRVKAINEDGVWDKKPLEFEFTINPPWWETLWFRIFAILTIIILIITYIKFRERKLIRDKRKLEKIVEERTAEVVRQKDEIVQKNIELSQQKEEIEAQRDLVTEQKEHIEEQKKEIDDSIQYAKRIQQALLPDLSVIARKPKADEAISEGKIASLPLAMTVDYFILFRPKDVVSGDFYWATQIREHIVITVADCTGHGVPGAFMSMLGISFLNEIVRKKEIFQANLILNELRNSIIEALSQSGEVGKYKDGMDISLIAIDTTPQAKTSEGFKPSEVLMVYSAQWAGANNPLWIIRNKSLRGFGTLEGVEQETLEEFKGDKMPIAIYERMDDFTNHELQLFSGDTIYMMSDGYEDQFGGPKHKKFLSKNLKQLLIANYRLSMNEQKEILEKSLVDWIGNGEQIDDITILGLKI